MFVKFMTTKGERYISKYISVLNLDTLLPQNAEYMGGNIDTWEFPNLQTLVWNSYIPIDMDNLAGGLMELYVRDGNRLGLGHLNYLPFTTNTLSISPIDYDYSWKYSYLSIQAAGDYFPLNMAAIAQQPRSKHISHTLSEKRIIYMGKDLPVSNFYVDMLPLDIIQLSITGMIILKLPRLNAFIHMIYLELCNIGLYTLPSVPPNLQYLYCDCNKLTELSKLPASIIYLNCSGNNLTQLATIHLIKLKNLFCTNNHITQLLELPDSLITLYCGDNPGLIIRIPPNIRALMCSRTSPLAADSLPYTITRLECEFSDDIVRIPPSVEMLMLGHPPRRTYILSNPYITISSYGIATENLIYEFPYNIIKKYMHARDMSYAIYKNIIRPLALLESHIYTLFARNIVTW
jgi:hypothetical protein